jgi:hypothetical protein
MKRHISAMSLKNSAIWRDEGFIHGKFTSGHASSTFEVRNPSNHDTLTSLPRMNARDVKVCLFRTLLCLFDDISAQLL